MNLRISAILSLSCLALGAFLSLPVRAQQQPGAAASEGTAPNQPSTSDQGVPDNRQMPVAPSRGLFVGSDTQPDGNATTPEPDTHALTGGEFIGMGDLQRPRNLLDFAAHVGETADTGINPGYVTSVSQLGGALNFDRTYGQSHTLIAYTGAALIFDPTYLPNQQAHTLGVSEDIEFQRWIIRLRDDFVASPQATFSGFDTGGFGAGQVGLLSEILPGLGPDETILTGYQMRINEVGLSEVDYRLSRRAEITFTGSYGILRFLQPGYINSYEWNGRVGYNYELDARDTIGVLYDYALVGYSGYTDKIASNLPQVTYGRKVLGRLAFEVAGGPQRLELSGYSSVAQTQWALNAYARVSYAQRRTNYAVTFSRGLAAGAGVLLGSYGDTIIGDVTHQLSRTWTVEADGGYAHNSNVAALQNVGLFSNYYGYASLSHILNRRLVFTLSYGFQKQDTGGVCPVANCGIASSRQFGGVTLDWHTQKFALN